MATTYHTYNTAENNRIESRNAALLQENANYQLAVSGLEQTLTKAHATNQGAYGTSIANAQGTLVTDLGTAATTYETGRHAAQVAAGAARNAVIPNDSPLHAWSVAQSEIWTASQTAWTNQLPDTNTYFANVAAATVANGTTVSNAGVTADHSIADRTKLFSDVVTNASLALDLSIESSLTDYLQGYDDATQAFDQQAGTADYNVGTGLWSVLIADDSKDNASGTFTSSVRDAEQVFTEEVAAAILTFETTVINAEYDLLTGTINDSAIYATAAIDADLGATGLVKTIAALDRDFAILTASNEETALTNQQTASPTPWTQLAAEEAEEWHQKVITEANAEYDRVVSEVDAAKTAADETLAADQQQALDRALELRDKALENAQKAYAAAIEQNEGSEIAPPELTPIHYAPVPGELEFNTPNGQSDKAFDGSFQMSSGSMVAYGMNSQNYVTDWDGGGFANTYSQDTQNYNSGPNVAFEGNPDWEGQRVTQRHVDDQTALLDELVARSKRDKLDEKGQYNHLLFTVRADGDTSNADNPEHDCPVLHAPHLGLNCTDGRPQETDGFSPSGLEPISIDPDALPLPPPKSHPEDKAAATRWLREQEAKENFEPNIGHIEDYLFAGVSDHELMRMLRRSGGNPKMLRGRLLQRYQRAYAEFAQMRDELEGLMQRLLDGSHVDAATINELVESHPENSRFIESGEHNRHLLLFTTPDGQLIVLEKRWKSARGTWWVQDKEGDFVGPVYAKVLPPVPIPYNYSAGYWVVVGSYNSPVSDEVIINHAKLGFDQRVAHQRLNIYQLAYAIPGMVGGDYLFYKEGDLTTAILITAGDISLVGGPVLRGTRAVKPLIVAAFLADLASSGHNAYLAFDAALSGKTGQARARSLAALLHLTGSVVLG